jgi:hypothetical protein
VLVVIGVVGMNIPLTGSFLIPCVCVDIHRRLGRCLYSTRTGFVFGFWLFLAWRRV